MTLSEPEMITAIVRYRLPATISKEDCRAHYESIAPDFVSVPGLISKHFLWSESGIAGGAYQWRTLADAKTFYSGPWLQGIIERYGNEPEIEYFEVFALAAGQS